MQRQPSLRQAAEVIQQLDASKQSVSEAAEQLDSTLADEGHASAPADSVELQAGQAVRSRLMDRVGNPPEGVAFHDNYWTRARWDEAFRELGLRVASWNDRIRLFPSPVDWVIGRSLHFVARLERAAPPTAGPSESLAEPPYPHRSADEAPDGGS